MSGPWFSDEELGLPAPSEGTVTIGGEVFKTNPVVMQVSREMLDDAMAMRDIVRDATDRWMNPWKYPDRAAWPSFVPLPALERACCAVLVARERIRDAWLVLLGQETLSDDRSDW